MDSRLIENLARCETDLDGALRRFSMNEALYVKCLNAFIDDPTMSDLENAINLEMWDDAFTAAHALKGLAGNMGFIPLFHATGELVVSIRAGRINEFDGLFERVNIQYKAIVSAIHEYNTISKQSED